MTAATLGEPARVERTLAVARVYLSFLSLFAIWLDPTSPERYAALAYSVLAAYVAYSIVVWVVAVRAQTAQFGIVVHVLDIVWASVLALLTEGPSSPLFLFFVFVLVQATFRWGLRATLITAGVAMVVLTGEVILLRGPWQLVEGDVELNRYLIRAVYLAIIGYLIGYLGDAQRRLQRDSAAAAAIAARLAGASGVRAAMTTIFEELLARFEAAHVLVALRERRTASTYLWEGSRASPESGVHVALSDLDPSEPDPYLGPAADAWLARPSRRKAGRDTIVSLDAEGRLREDDPVLPLAELRGRHGMGTVLSASVSIGPEWSGRVYIVDPRRASEQDLRSLQSLVRQLGPAVENVYLVRRLRTRAGTAERARVARELHDGVIQSLIGLEMQLDVLRQQAVAKSEPHAGALTGIQELLREEVLAVRELMEQIRPMDVGPREILDHLAVMVDKFRRETGIAAVFVSSLEELALPPRVCREIARIVQEALVNVRKHASARNVLVRLDRNDGCCMLVVDDDGRGFEFAGRVTQGTLDAERKGPLVIKERVREAGGEMSIDSSPGHGSRLEIRFPERRRA